MTRRKEGEKKRVATFYYSLFHFHFDAKKSMLNYRLFFFVSIAMGSGAKGGGRTINPIGFFFYDAYPTPAHTATVNSFGD